jgi:hypothetical protein
MRTSDILIRCVYQDILPPPNVLADYFGFTNLMSKDNLTIIFGLYSGLIKYELVTSNELDTHCRNNTLDNFIREKYDELLQESRKSGYYTEFCEKGIIIDVGLGEEEDD